MAQFTANVTVDDEGVEKTTIRFEHRPAKARPDGQGNVRDAAWIRVTRIQFTNGRVVERRRVASPQEEAIILGAYTQEVGTVVRDEVLGEAGGRPTRVLAVDE